MKVLWKSESCTAQDVIDALAKEQSWGPATIKTLLNRLVGKGALKFRKEGRAYIYSAAVGETECREAVSTGFLDRVFDGALCPFLAHFVQQGRKLKPEDIAELEKILKETRKKS
jgi:BlaI family transcriptional regulator, penicillinase repressor